MSHQEDDGDSVSEFMRQRIKHQTMAHLRDILRTHGAGRHWSDLAIPQGIPHVIERVFFHSAIGSPGALCVAEGDRERAIAADIN